MSIKIETAGTKRHRQNKKGKLLTIIKNDNGEMVIELEQERLTMIIT